MSATLPASTQYAFAIPTLETERLVLRGWRESDAEGYAEFYSDGQNTHFIGGPLSASDAWRMMAQRIGQWHLRGYAFFALEEKSSGDFIGHCGPHFPAGWPEPEIGWGLIKRYQGHGYATEAARMALAFAYAELGWQSAISLVDAVNTSSAKVAMRLGAKYERTATVTSFTADVYRHLPPSQFLN